MTVKSLYGMMKLSKLLPDLSPLNRWMHGIFKNKARDFVNRYGESEEMQRILDRKLNSPGWVNPEIADLWNRIGAMMEKERGEWHAKDDRGNTINRNERFWKNLRILVCVTLDEDTYYFRRYKDFMEIRD